jgi:hypothetical protein
LPPRWDIRASRVRWRIRPGSSFIACSESKFDSRRSRWRAISFWRLTLSSSSEAAFVAVDAFFSEIAGLGTLVDYFQQVLRIRITMNDLFIVTGGSSITS